MIDSVMTYVPETDTLMQWGIAVLVAALAAGLYAFLLRGERDWPLLGKGIYIVLSIVIALSAAESFAAAGGLDGFVARIEMNLVNAMLALAPVVAGVLAGAIVNGKTQDGDYALGAGVMAFVLVAIFAVYLGHLGQTVGKSFDANAAPERPAQGEP